MHDARMGRKRPCSVCRRWYHPDARVRRSQRTCGAAECRETQRRRTHKRYRDAHPDYWTARRLREQTARAEVAESGAAIRPPPAEMSRVPWDLAQDAFGSQGAVLLSFFLRLAIRSAKDAIGMQAPEIPGEFGRLQREAAQDATDRRGSDDYRPP